MTLRARAEQAAKEALNASGVGALPYVNDLLIAAFAAAIERVAKEFAEAALRTVICEWNAIECGPQASCDKAIAAAIAEAEKG